MCISVVKISFECIEFVQRIIFKQLMKCQLTFPFFVNCLGKAKSRSSMKRSGSTSPKPGASSSRQGTDISDITSREEEYKYDELMIGFLFFFFVMQSHINV